jgi:hypothetical protein
MNIVKPHHLIWIAAGCAPCASAAAAAECDAQPLITPVQGTTLHEIRPEIAWRAVPGARSYRVQIESRVPEGRVIERVDAEVSGNRFVPPRPLADARAAVKVLVTTDCAGVPNLNVLPAWFFIDATAACPPVDALAFSAGRVQWGRSSAATRYDVEMYSETGGRMLAREETPLASAPLPAAPGPILVAVRPRCGTIVGPAVYGLAPAGR